MSHSKVMGIDLSLTSTGVALAANAAIVGSSRIQTTGKRADTLVQRQERLDGITTKIMGLVQVYQPDLVVIESPSYGSQHGSQHDRSGLWWLVVDSIISNGTPLATVTPNGRAKYATGKGNAGKDAVLAAVVKQYAEVEVTGNDVADAVVLAAMGSRHLGYAFDGLSEAHLSAMDGASWPV